MSSLLRAGVTGVTLPRTGNNNNKKKDLETDHSAVLSEKKKNPKTTFSFLDAVRCYSESLIAAEEEQIEQVEYRGRRV